MSEFMYYLGDWQGIESVKILLIPLQNTNCPLFQLLDSRNQLGPGHQWFWKTIWEATQKIRKSGDHTNFKDRKNAIKMQQVSKET